MKVEETNKERMVTCKVGWEKGGREGFGDRDGEDLKQVRLIKDRKWKSTDDTPVKCPGQVGLGLGFLPRLFSGMKEKSAVGEE